MDREYIKAKLANIPEKPGSYQMKDKNGEIIYVGKAKNLHARVNQYFTGSHDFKTTKMVSNIEDFDFIVVGSEKEALVLESALIKKYRPKYNIKLMDDSSYPYIKLSGQDVPRLSIARDMKKDKKSKYFGPFPDANKARDTLRLLQNLYPFPRCAHFPAKVCLYYHMNQCLGPCVHKIDPQVYKDMSIKVERFLNGDTAEIVHELRQKMNDASEALEFEKALEYKNLLEAIDSVTADKQRVDVDKKGNLDAFAWVADKGYLAVAGFLVRSGTVLNKEFKLSPLYGDAEEAFVSFLVQYYEEHPGNALLLLPQSMHAESVAALCEVLSIKAVQPQKGYRRQLISMCEENARQQLELKFNLVERQASQTQQAVEDLGRCAGRAMNRVELFDNSHTAGTFTVAACVVYQDGMPEKKDYRLYRLHTANSDFDSMKEVLYRRYFRILKEGGRLPDGILVDGGRTQVEAACSILSSLGLLDQICVMGLVKDEHHNTDGLLDQNGQRIPVDKNSSLFFLLTRMQDEVHRVAIGYHRKLRSKAQTRSILDEIEGVGPARKKALLKHFGSLAALKEASVEELSKVVPMAVAEKVYVTLREMV